jgi:hypothetical protein
MNLKYLKIENDSYLNQEGYKKYIQEVQVSNVEKNEFDGLLSLFIDSRLAVTQISDYFKSKEPISTAGNALFPEIKKLKNFGEENVIVTHGIYPTFNDNNQPACGGHLVAFDNDLNHIYRHLIQNLKPYVKNSLNDYKPLETAKNLGKIWHASEIRFYDHSTGWLYDSDDLHNKYLGVTPSIFHDGLHPTIGQDPSLIILNTLGKPYFTISKGHLAREIGGVVEIFYPKTELPQTIIESLVFCLQHHYNSKKYSIGEMSQFKNSDTLLLLVSSEENVEILTKSILSSTNSYHKKFIEGYFLDPKDIILALVPELDRKIFEIKLS